MRGWNDETGKFELMPEDYAALETFVPKHLQGGLRLYIESGVPTGSFLEAVMSNDLMGAISRADSNSFAGLKGIAMFVWNHCPMQCHGSPEAYHNWLKMHAEKRDQIVTEGFD